MATIDLPDDIARVAIEEARLAGIDVKDWVANIISARAHKDHPDYLMDDFGWPSPVIPEQATSPVTRARHHPSVSGSSESRSF